VIRQTVASVNLEAVQANLRAIQDLVAREAGDAAGPRPGIIAVVKANAYGHGAAEVGPALEAAGASMLACADIEEGIRLRDAGVRIPILVFGALSVSDLDGVFTSDLTPTVSTPWAARALEAVAARRHATLRCHLKLDTGMNRLGFRHDNLRRTLPDVLSSPHLRFEAVYTHFATADDPQSPFFDEQRGRFDRACAELGVLGLRQVKRHSANSAALLRDRRTWYDWIRPGLLLYGIVPPPLASSIDLRPALSLRSRIVAVKGLRPGEATGYGLRWRADDPRTLAIVPAGYADGLDTRMSGRASVLVRGRRVPVVGAVSMDMLMVDVTGLDVSPGDDVIIIGRQGDDEITAREMAAAIGTIPWEIVCRLGARIERRYETSQDLMTRDSDSAP
jgi:alanine racemase